MYLKDSNAASHCNSLILFALSRAIGYLEFIKFILKPLFFSQGGGKGSTVEDGVFHVVNFYGL